MREIVTTTAFRKDQKRMRKRGKDLNKLLGIVERLAEGRDLEPRHRPHPLTGDWKPLWDLHIEPDWLLESLTKRFTLPGRAHTLICFK